MDRQAGGRQYEVPNMRSDFGAISWRIFWAVCDVAHFVAGWRVEEGWGDRGECGGGDGCGVRGCL